MSRLRGVLSRAASGAGVLAGLPAPAPLEAVVHGRLTERLALLDEVLHGGTEPDPDSDAVRARLVASLVPSRPDLLWLVVAVVGARLPQSAEVERLLRELVLDGASATLDRVLREHALDFSRARGRRVRVVTGTLVDVHHTSRTGMATGIQRVSRELVRRWDAEPDHEVVLVGWSDGLDSLRLLAPAERRTALGERTPADPSPADAHLQADEDEVVVPWGARYVLPELALEPERTSRLRAMARWSGTRCSAIGFDCVPITSSETTDVMVSEHFANNLAALRHFDHVVAISESAAREYRGWCRMLSAIGEPGPRVDACLLPAHVGDVDDETLETTRRRMTVGALPMVLCVGTHEPRKNHLAVLQAAERAWRDGMRFTLAFVGGNAWNSGGFVAELGRLQQAGRPVENFTVVDDDMLWSAFRLARFMVFPSLNEGFGLPVAECLAAGTPVLTSGHGSLAEIAAGGGALTIDPRDDDALAAAFARMVRDDSLVARLRREAVARAPRTWEDYAGEIWDILGDRTQHGDDREPETDISRAV
ncbi:glycosyltransferase [Aquipuribacter hungaricus]|uniref:Glycosyltransferase n=1 Tax=Aquipuribacter hungaricus TaxID=545624 RepID=A0ABV7WL56_9MICO